MTFWTVKRDGSMDDEGGREAQESVVSSTNITYSMNAATYTRRCIICTWILAYQGRSATLGISISSGILS